MKKVFVRFFMLAGVVTLLSSCSTANLGVSKANVYYEFGRNDMDVSAQKTAEAKQIKVFGIDFLRLFKKESGNFNADGYAGEFSSIPLVGSYINPTKVQNYALFNLLQQEPGFDFVLYPRFEQKSTGIPLLFVVTKTKVTARLGKIK